MQRLTLTLKLLDPLVLSQSNATVGLHQSLDFIPGAAFLGAIASKHYASFKKQNLAQTIFHSGEVRFHNARILYNAQPTNPIPLSYHHIKGKNKNQVSNLLVTSINEGQPKQHRAGYITQDATHIKPKKTTHLRTAINPKTATAAESQLFGYQALAEGITLQTHIDCDNEAAYQALKASIQTGNILHIGRSRSAHYGRIQITDITEHSPSFEDYPTININGDTYLVLWLASDLAVYNHQTGAPTLFPNLKDLGLSIDADPTSKSYIRTRSYAPYNGYRRSYDLSRQVIQQGSILTYEIDTPLSETDKQTLQQGLGAYREMGLGQIVPIHETVWLSLIQNQTPILKTTDDHPQTEKPSVTETPLTTLLKTKKTQIEARNEIEQAVEKALFDLCQRMQSIRRYLGIGKQPIGPTKTQWGMIRDRLTKATFNTPKEVAQTLFKGKNAPIPEDDEVWSQNDGGDSFEICNKDERFKECKKDKENGCFECWYISNGNYSFRDWLKKEIKRYDDKTKLNLYLRTLARVIAENPTLQKVQQGQLDDCQALQPQKGDK